MEDYEEVEVGHRHISPLFGLYPGNEFDIRRTPELATACLRTIERRTSTLVILIRRRAIRRLGIEGGGPARKHAHWVELGLARPF